VVAESGRIVGAELLLRWKPPEGELSPAIFIPIAEMTGAIVPIGAWVFREACRVEVEWRRRWGENAPYVSVNVSARQLNEESLVDDFAATLRETGADPARLLLEITETSLMADVESNLRILRRLADLGLRVAVDDFGTGYSSLAQLTRLPVNVLKIDRAFVDGIDKSEESRTIIRAVIGLGRALGLKLVAEGVENGAQQRELCAYGCDLIQGYYFHRPLEEAVFVETLDRELREDVPGSAPSLHFLIYVSQASESLSRDDLDTLLQKARSFNRTAGISGCLVYQDGYFMQMLEGKREVLLALMDHVKTDPRHRDVRIVIEGPARQRVFRDWGMVLRDLRYGPDSFNDTDFTPWQRRKLSFFDLADDARTCFSYITAYGRS
jgi:EAL domain-containing protein (putative c-di-GMP-specific phosphodiesterase class I)